MRTIEVPEAVTELSGEGATAFVDSGDDAETTLVITPNEWGSENRNGRVSLVMIEGTSVCGFQCSNSDIERIVAALRYAGRFST